MTGSVGAAGALSRAPSGDADRTAQPAEEHAFGATVDTVVDLRDPEQAAEFQRRQQEVLASGERPDLSVGVIPAEPVAPGRERARADEERAAAEPDDGPTPAPPRCPTAPDGTPAVAFTCGGGYGPLGSEALAASGDAARDMQAALRALAAGPSERGRAAGMGSALQGLDLGGVTVRRDGETLALSFDARFGEALRDHLPAQGVSIVAQITATATSIRGITGWQGDIEGDCTAFALAVEGDECVTYTDDVVPTHDRAGEGS